MKIDLKIVRGADGRPVLHFPFMAVSDIHWGTDNSRARRLSHMFEHTSCGQLHMIGDIVDGQALLDKKRWNWGEWHRQGMAHVLRRAAKGARVTFYKGNHESGLYRTVDEDGLEKPRHGSDRTKIFGVQFTREGEYRHPSGARFRIFHGDRFDAQIYKTPEQRDRLYKTGDKLLKMGGKIDRALEKGLGSEFSVTGAGKRMVKSIIDEHMGARKAVIDWLDASKYDGVIYGHTHMSGFERTPGGKLKINDGCSTEHVETLVHDQAGNWALLDWRKRGLRVTEPDGTETQFSWKELGLPDATNDPVATEDAHTHNADRLLRLIAMKWPSKERQAQIGDLRQSTYLSKKYRAASNAVHRLPVPGHRAERVRGAGQPAAGAVPRP
jgi:UDP-2,3-diacylglucosamine pyrophosphatase LpxH